MAESKKTFSDATIENMSDQDITTISGLPTIPSNATLNSVYLYFDAYRKDGAINGGKVTVRFNTGTQVYETAISKNTQYNDLSVDLTKYVTNSGGTLSYNNGASSLIVHGYQNFQYVPYKQSDWTISDIRIVADYTPHTHSYGNPTYTWSSDGKSCTAKRTCGCGAAETSAATVTSAVKTNATCLAMGTTTYTAKFSASWATTQTKDVQDIAQKSHSYTGAIKSDGNGKDATHSFKCVNGCNNYGGAAKHTWNGGEVTKQSTCTDTGVKTYTCTASGCGGTYTEIVSKNPTNHSGSQVTLPAVAPTCTETGLTEGKKWSCCNTSITAQQTVAALDHNYASHLSKWVWQ